MKQVKFGEIADFRNGLNFNKSHHGPGCLIIGIPNFRDRMTPDISSLDEISISGIASEEDFVQQGDILFVRSNGNKNLVGRSLFIDKNIEAVFSGFCIRARLNSPLIEPKFCFYFTRTATFKSFIAPSGGTSIQNLNQEILSNVKLPLLSIEEQNKIVKVLSDLDNKIEINNKINIELEAIARLVFNYWFVQFDFPNAQGKPYKTSGGKMVWSRELNKEIPLGWEVKMLFDGMDVQYGFPFSTSKFTHLSTHKPVIRIRDILENTISLYTTEEVDDKYRLLRNDLLIGMDGNFHLNFWDKEGAYLNQRSVRIRPRANSNVSNFQAYFELQPHIKAKEENVSRTTVGHLSDKDLKRLFVLNAKKTERFNPRKTFDSFLDKITANRIENQKLTELRDWLLPMLMNGQVRIKDSLQAQLKGNRATTKPFVPKDIYLYQSQIFALIADVSKQHKIKHGEMTLGKYSYTLEKIYGIPTFFTYARHHLGPWAKEMKKVVLNKKNFKIDEDGISVVNQDLLADNPYETQIRTAVKDLASIFLQYKGKERSFQTELLATVCKVIEDIQSTDLVAVRDSMKKWPIKLKGEKFTNKAEKFGERETDVVLSFIVNKQWDKLLCS
jgi:type I restriction enzyme S subunit